MTMAIPFNLGTLIEKDDSLKTDADIFYQANSTPLYKGLDKIGLGRPLFNFQYSSQISEYECHAKLQRELARSNEKVPGYYKNQIYFEPSSL